MFFRQFYNEPLAQMSYLVACEASGEAVVVDPNRDIGQYINMAQEHGFRIVAVTETHIHADYVSGARELAQRTGARLYLSGAGPAEWQYKFAAEAGATLLRDGDTFGVGRIRFQTLHTPGHTPEHVSFLLVDGARSPEPVGIFTGDFVFVGDVGRPDLLERAVGVAGSAEQGARQLFRSLARFRALPDHVQVWPAHGAGSACGRSLGAMPQSTVGYERIVNWAMHIAEEEQFVREVLAGQPPSPPYFAVMKRVNRDGPPPAPPLPPGELPLAAAEGLLVIDTRPPREYARGHLAGSINLPWDRSFVTWAGWIIPYDRDFGLIVEPGQASAAAAALQLIGLDRLAGYWPPSAVQEWERAGQPIRQVNRVSPEVAGRLIAETKAAVIDLRRDDERQSGYIPGSRHIPFEELQLHLTGLVREGQPLLLHCHAGTRSALAAGLLSAAGVETIYDLEGGYLAWQQHHAAAR